MTCGEALILFCVPTRRKKSNLHASGHTISQAKFGAGLSSEIHEPTNQVRKKHNQGGAKTAKNAVNGKNQKVLANHLIVNFLITKILPKFSILEHSFGVC